MPEQILNESPQTPEVEDTFLIACLTEHRQLVGFKTVKSLAFHIVDTLTTGLAEGDVARCLRGQTPAREMRRDVANAALIILSLQLGKVTKKFIEQGEPETAEYLRKLVIKRGDPALFADGIADVNSAADVIFKNWKELSRKEIESRPLMRPGLFQVFRRYKPMDLRGGDATAAADHHVIVELCMIDFDRAMLITSELKTYNGTVFINHEHILFSLLQRRSTRRPGGINHRFVTLRLSSEVLPFYSGLTVKVGETTHRPLAAECLFLLVPETEEHADLYKAFRELGSGAMPGRLANDSIFADYVTSNPPRKVSDENDPRHQRTRLVKDFPFLVPLVKPRGKKPALLREPSRTLDPDDINGAKGKLPVFRQSGGSR